ncbi:hypothetical protein [Allopontixanthobacter sp.]|uniref:hypothetical protein n=1 Tax=Allopontixanthobacter sp. TaxID=2906452 RepID=UPI002AB909EC|nr:hypothetical protein [Allopontixanthobacter sp.]MDZ4308700.1 hypothetical protein [Allopontixanthobacter sp.]
MTGKKDKTGKTPLRRVLFAGAGAAALCSALAVAHGAPTSLLPPGFDDPTPAPSPAPRPASTPRPAAPPATPVPGGTPVVQPLPSPGERSVQELINVPDGLPSLSELESMDADELDELLGLKPKFDIPPAARRSLSRVGILASTEGGLPPAALANQPASIVRAALTGTRGPVVSRWGHIMLRRALASRLAAPQGMDPVEFAALRANALNRLGEFSAARTLVQDVDTSNWDKRLTDTALTAYIGTADLVGACPAVKLQGGGRDDPQWKMLQSICDAYSGQEVRANTQLNRALSRQIAPDIDVLLAQRYAGAAGRGRRAVTLEWDTVDDMTPWRFALATAVGAEIPAVLLEDAGAYYERVSAVAPMLALPQRIAGSARAASEGILSSAALVDLYAQIYAVDDFEDPAAETAELLQTAYVGGSPQDRLAAMKSIWSVEGPSGYSGLVLTAYAAARMPVSEDFEADAGQLIASMLAAGLDRNALRWAPVVEQGSEGWALLALAQPARGSPVGAGGLDSFFDDDSSSEQRKSKFLLAGLAGLGRVEPSVISDLSGRVSIDLGRQSKWSRLIDRAAEVRNPALVAYLAGVGMQGEGWDKMTALHLYHIVSALNRVGMEAEARMIAAEAVARG